MWVGLRQSVEGLNSTRDWLSLSERNVQQLAIRLDCSIDSCLGLWPAAHPADFGLASFHKCTNKLLKINLFVYVCRAYWLFFWTPLTSIACPTPPYAVGVASFAELSYRVF